MIIFLHRFIRGTKKSTKIQAGGPERNGNQFRATGFSEGTIACILYVVFGLS